MKEFYETAEVVAASAAIFEKHGFVSKRNNMGVKPSSARLYDHFKHHGNTDITVTDEHRDQAQDIILYFKGLTIQATQRKLSDFEVNIIKLVSAETIPPTGNSRNPINIGSAAIVPKVYADRIKQEAWEEQESLVQTLSDYVGTVRRFSTFTLEVRHVRQIRDPYQTKYLVCGLADGQNIVKFFVDSSWIKCFNVGQVVDVHGAVNVHQENEYSGAKETLLNRINFEKTVQKDPELT